MYTEALLTVKPDINICCHSLNVCTLSPSQVSIGSTVDGWMTVGRRVNDEWIARCLGGGVADG